jgi:chemotaxis protein CheC
MTDIGQVPDLLGGAEKVVAGVTLQIFGDARGNILLIFPRDSAQRLLARLLRSEEKGLIFNELGASTLKEVGNILASAYLNAMGSLLHLTLIPSVPLLACDMAGAVVDYVLIELSQAGDLALMVETEFHGTNPELELIKGHFFLLPDPASLDLILNAVGGV